MKIEDKELIIKEFLNKYKDYEDDTSFMIKQYNELIKKCKDEKRQPSEFEFKKIKLETEKREKEIINDMEYIKFNLRKFSQEMLVLMHNMSNNESINRLIEGMIMENNVTIESINSYCESGVIFEKLEDMSNEQINKLLSLRENNNRLLFNNKEVINFSLNARNILKQKLNGNLDEAKRKFCEDHNLSSELEFQFYKNNYRNKEIIKIATAIQEVMNDMLEIDDDTVIKKAQEQLTTIDSKIYK